LKLRNRHRTKPRVCLYQNPGVGAEREEKGITKKVRDINAKK